MGDLAIVETPSDTQPITRVCSGHHSDGSGTPCDSPIVMANGKCRVHGGATPGGMASANFKHGGRSKYLPKRMLEKWNEALNDPQLLGLHDAAVTLEMRMRELFASLDERNSSELWDATQKSLGLYEKALRSGKQSQIDEAWHVHKQTVTDGYNEAQKWREIRAITQEQVVVSKEERNRLKDMGQTMTYQQANVLLANVAAAVHKRISNREERALLAADIYALMTAER